MNTDNLLMLNFCLTVALAFIAYRQHVVGGFHRQREREEIHQEIRNNIDYVNRRFEELEDRHSRDLNEVYRDFDSLWRELPKKSTKGINSRIPL